LSAEVYYKTGASSYSYSTNIFSPEYLYNNIKPASYCSGGTAMIENYNYLVNNGIVLFSEVPYSWSNGCDTIVSSAPKQKISSYQFISPSDRAAMKQAIYDKHPLGFVFTADRDWYYGDGSANYVWKGPYSTEIYGGHGTTVVGWDDSKNAWLTINSFGPTWGDAGYRWIDYDWFAYITSRCYKIVL
jgi:C1A family cysteine protease